jgi:hypothetical protein
MTCYMTDPDGRTSHKKQNRNCDYSQNLVMSPRGAQSLNLLTDSDWEPGRPTMNKTANCLKYNQNLVMSPRRARRLDLLTDSQDTPRRMKPTTAFW